MDPSVCVSAGHRAGDRSGGGDEVSCPPGRRHRLALPGVTGQVHLVPQQTASARSVSPVASLAIFTAGMSSNTGWRSASATKSSTGESLVAWKYGRVEGAMRTYRLRTGPASSARDLPDGVVTRVAAAGQVHPPGRASVVYPGHRPVGGDQPAAPVVIHRDHGIGTRLAGRAASGGQQVGPGHQARPDERAHDRVLNVAAAAWTVLPRRPGTSPASACPSSPFPGPWPICGRAWLLPPSAGCTGLRPGASPACYRCRNGSRMA